MRISDWSSDVCSSDLGQAGNADAGEVVVVARLPGFLVLVGEVADLDEVHQLGVGAVDVGEAGVAAHLLVADAEGVDRKGVVKGKSVSVRVDFGVRRIITKKKR